MSTRGYPITRQIKEERRKKAEERQELYDEKSLQQKLETLPVGGARKQRSKLEAMIDKQPRSVPESVQQESEVQKQEKLSNKKIKKSKQ